MAENLKFIKRIPHLVGTGGNAVVVSIPDLYDSIGSVVGVAKLTGEPPDGAGGGEVSDLMKNGQAIRIRIAYKIGTKRKTADILCAVDKIKTAIHALPSKTFNGGDVISAFFPRRRRLG